MVCFFVLLFNLRVFALSGTKISQHVDAYTYNTFTFLGTQTCIYIHLHFLEYPAAGPSPAGPARAGKHTGKG